MNAPRALAVVGCLALSYQFCHAIDVFDDTGGGATPQSLAQIIVANSTGVTLIASSANTTINTGGGTGPASDTRAYGVFVNGMTPSGTLLPAANQNASGTAAYAGGIGSSEGVCLCTGVLEDEPSAATTGRGSGVLGPNNGLDNTSSQLIHPGEIVTVLGSPIDQDFVNATGLQGGGDATVLAFDVQLASPGLLRVSFIFGSDENPAFIDQLGVNDSVAIIVNGENIATVTKVGDTTPFRLFEFADCGPPLFISNDVAPSPSALVGSDHAIPTADRYDIEFGGFTKLLVRETACPLAPGTYTVKFVVQDVADAKVDAAVFIKDSSLKLYNFLPADFNLDGSINSDDFNILALNFGQCGKRFTEGDANGDRCVNSDDFNILSLNFSQTGGNRDLKFDFNRDNTVNEGDLLIWQEHSGLLDECASRFEGDADGDGDVDAADQPPHLSTVLASPCGGSGGGEALSAGSDDEELTSEGAAASTEATDIDQDGDVDFDDVELFGQTIASE